MIQVTLNVALTLEGPVLTKSSTPGRYGVDSLMAVDSKGRYYIPGSLIKGKLREAWSDLQDAADGEVIVVPEKWLGDSSENKENKITAVDPYRGVVHFSDFIHEGISRQDTLHRIKINEELGTVETGQLQVIESPFAAGEKVCFHGRISFIEADEKTLNKVSTAIEIGLRWMTNVGAYRTIGFGRLVNVAISRIPATVAVTEKSLANNPAHITMTITPSAPFCISRRRLSRNLFESDSVIPGGVIRGAIASSWGAFINKGLCPEINAEFDPARPELCRHFDTIRIRHAFPMRVEKEERPIKPPLSLVKIDKKGYYDVALCSDPTLIDGKAPEFSIDWKDRSNVDTDFHWAEPERELRVRTAMEQKFRKAKDEQLFAYEMIVPDGHKWCSVVDLNHVPDDERPLLIEQLRELLSHGLNGWGKTKVSSNVQIDDCKMEDLNIKHFSGFYIVTLQTPAIFCDPLTFTEGSGKDELYATYSNVWEQISGGALKLKHCFASQSFAGGEYLRRRFQNINKEYRPYLLTDAGSVFVLDVKNESDAEKKIKEWLAQGLPVPGWFSREYVRNGNAGDHWMNCPYLPQNGYGEIAVNLDVHWRKSPTKEVWNAV